MSSSTRDSRFLIAGAGIGGLSAAIALARRDIETRVLERTASFSGEGAGIQLGPNATRILDEWGVLDRLSTKAVVSEGIVIGDGLTGARITGVPFGKVLDERYGAPFLLLHRGDLHQALVDVAEAHSGIDITLDCDVQSYEQSPAGVTVRTSQNEINGRALIAADGLWSRLRTQIDRGAQLKFTGKTAWRCWVKPGDLPEWLDGPWTGLWLSANAHLVHYPVRGGEKFNIVAVTDERWGGRTQGWDHEADPDALLPAFAEWNEHIAGIVRAGTSWRKWSLFYMPPLRSWSQGSATLLGDAAHPVLPFLAQGGAMAIEDAAVLARLVTDHDGNPWPAFRAFEDARLERTAKTSYESRKMGSIYHMGGVSRLARNFVMRRQSRESLLKRLDWLYRFEDTA